MRLPSLSVKLRTQPTLSLRSSPSIRLSTTTSCQRSWLLKSRSTAQTRSIGASITVDRTTCCSTGLAPREVRLEGVEAALEDALADRLDELLLARLGAVELRAPLGEAARAVGHRRELERGDVVLDAHRALEDLVDARIVEVGKREQPLADHAAVAGVEVADATDPVARFAVLDPAVGDTGMPLRQAVEVADARPDGVGAGVDDARRVDADHRARRRGAPRQASAPSGGSERSELGGFISFLLRCSRRQRDLGAADAADEALDVAAFDAD